MVLVVDDVLANGIPLVRLLRLAGYEAEFLDCAQKLFTHLRAQPAPNLIILDVMMPDMDGLQCLATMRANPAWRNVPVLMYSADNSPTRMEDAMRLGAREFIVKGGKGWDELLEKICSHSISA